MLKNDIWIREMAAKGMISPFVPNLVRKTEDGSPIISYGLSSYGYDIRLSPAGFYIFRHIPGTVIDPKKFNPANLEPAELHEDEHGSFFILPRHTYALGVAMERLEVPRNITVICIGKSTYARTGVISNLTPAEACMSSDTDVLARTGWKRLADVIIGEEVLTWNPNSKKAEYQPVEDKQSYYYNGELLHFCTRFVDQMVTPNHRMWAGLRRRRVECLSSTTRIKGVTRNSVDTFEWDFIPAKEMYGKWAYYLDRKVDWTGLNPYGDVVSIGKYRFSVEDWCRFIGAWMGDGSAFDNGNGNYIIKLAVVTKEEKRHYFRALLSSMGVNFHESEWGFAFQDKAVTEYLLPYTGAKNKHLPAEIKQLPPALLALVLEGFMASDGNKETNTYGSASSRLTDDFQEVAIKAGYHATCWEQTKWSDFTKTEGTQYKCRYSSANSYPNKVQPDKHMSKVPYSGMVYDITVPNHIFLSRRNGRASWTGNSWKGHLTLEFSNSSQADCRLYVREGIVQLLFLEGEPCEVSYEDRSGKYQDQSEVVTIARV